MSKINDLAAELRGLLSTGAFPPGSRFPSEYELQERFSVSRVTANKAVALLAAEGLLCRGRRGSGTYVQKTEVFPRGWIAAIEDFKHPYNMGMISGAAQEAFSRGYMLSVFPPEKDDLARLIKQLRQSDCIGVLGCAYLLKILPPDFPKPVIYLDGGIEPHEEGIAHSVMCDNYGAAVEMMNRIVQAGKKQIVTLGIEKSLNRKLRMQGFRDAMRDCGIPDAGKREFIMHHGSRHDVRIALRKIISQFPDVDFIATDSDDIVFSIMKIWGSERENWQQMTGLSGFGNVHGISDLHHIPSVEQHPWHIGSEAVKAMIELVSSGSREQPFQILVPAEVVNAEFI